MPNHKVIAVIGGGASGTIFALHAQQFFELSSEIVVIERSGVFGAGLAYDLSEPCFLLNVRADRMGAYADRPAHFYEWMQAREDIWPNLHPRFKDAQYGADDFVPRLIYGAYLKDLFQKAMIKSGGAIRAVHDEVLRINAEGNRLRITLAKGVPVFCDHAVFATGNSYSRLRLQPSQNVFVSPYHQDFLERSWKDARHVAIAGTGLSMVDTVMALNEKGYAGQISAISRHGLIPLPHKAKSAHGITTLNLDGELSRISDVIRNVRRGLGKDDWQEKIDSLRPFSNPLWKRLRVDQQKKLMRAAPWWSIARHRIPDDIFCELESMKNQGKLKIMKDEIRGVRERESHVEIELLNQKILFADAVVNCTGFSYAAENVQKLCPDLPLNRHWMGCLQPVSGSDFRVCEDHKLYALGPLFYGWNFESTAVHEIRQQAKDLAEEINQ